MTSIFFLLFFVSKKNKNIVVWIVYSNLGSNLPFLIDIAIVDTLSQKKKKKALLLIPKFSHFGSINRAQNPAGQILENWKKQEL